MNAVLAMDTLAVADGEGNNHEVTDGKVPDFAADVLNDADELVSLGGRAIDSGDSAIPP